jgi:2-oxoglutarate dehydrogenase E1 component
MFQYLSFLFPYRNMGAYSYVNPRIMTATREINKEEKRPRYVGRAVSAAPATGMARAHQAEYQDILSGVFGDPQKDVFAD